MIERLTLIFLMRAQTYLRDSTSKPEVGSSKMIRRDPPTKAIASESFLFIPPESVLDILFLCSLSITMSIISLIWASMTVGLMFFSSHTRLRCSLTVRCSNRTSNYWQRPKLYLTPSKSVSRLCPYIEALPLLGLRIPVTS